ncbi:hypothetical protein PYW08_009952 [Mythimna loreyi]|uniref:Uncharacterized protein n=1 Tax=Mythimna loreyi TaxID=667449 RepID=A0ACC2Q582_9NEOP|nr:hypothetical protein PYW08_009952 [Mythimna loreyi]
MLRECVLLVTVSVFGVGSLSGRGFFCRDPDTGKLHPANSTWTATSFCGKYHCKLKRKNITSTQYAPLRQINITDIQLLGQNLTTIEVQKKDIFVKKNEDLNNVVNIENKTELDITDENNNTVKDQGITLQDIIDDKNASDKDRYLSDQEIKSLTEVLHTLKKGDLEAIVEIYNLAQDIYKEIDKTSTDHALNEVMATTKTLSKEIFKSDVFRKMAKYNNASYWYEPLASGKSRPDDLLRPDVIRTDINPEVQPIAIGVGVPVPLNVVPKPTPRNLLDPMSLNIPPVPAYQIRKISDSFFNGPLSYTDFGKLPYYYPMSNFQRMSSYKHKQNNKQTANIVTPAPVPFRLPPVMTTMPTPSIVNTADRNQSLYISVKNKKKLNSPTYLPYPFINMQHYNWSYPQSAFNRNKLDTRRKEESLFDKLELLRKEENLFGTLRKEEYNVDPLEKHRKQEYSVDPLEKHRKQENILDRLDSLTKEENLFNQFGTRRKEETFVDRLGMRRKEDNSVDRLGIRRKDDDTVDKSGMHKKNDDSVDKLGMPRKQENIVKKIGLLTKEENMFEPLGRTNTDKFSGPLDPLRKDDINTIRINHNGPIAVGKKSNAILMNPDLENFQDLQIRLVEKKENTVNTNVKQEEGDRGRRLIERRRPEWQTNSLSQQILDEVRGHLMEKQRLFIHPVPLRKKVKLERVAKLLNMDKLTRRKRSLEEPIKQPNKIDEPLEPELFEVYIESTTCNADYTIPGYFRYGNLSQPFPECCPQRIPTR